MGPHVYVNQHMFKRVYESARVDTLRYLDFSSLFFPLFSFSLTMEQYYGQLFEEDLLSHSLMSYLIWA
jgi:hypothetical protein